MKRKDAEDALRPLLTDEFFSTLVLAARTIGWGVDLIEVNNFIEHCYTIADKEFSRASPIVPEGFDYTDDSGTPKI
jgi:hypothetical protein